MIVTVYYYPLSRVAVEQYYNVMSCNFAGDFLKILQGDGTFTEIATSQIRKVARYNEL